ncbi:MAG: BREX-2 system phosphatase PglZ, partial [Kineosporiaceae bacterium]
MGGPALTTPAPERATPALVRHLVGEARRDDRRYGDYRRGVIGLHALAEWPGDEQFAVDGVTIRVVPCPSVLALHDALRDRPRQDGHFHVLLTPVEPGAVPASVRAHLVWGRVRRPDAWAAVKRLFGARELERRLDIRPDGRELAGQLVALREIGGYPPAPSGVLTVDHLVAAVALRHLRLGTGVAGLAPDTVLAWSASPPSAVAWERLHDEAPTVADLVLGTIAEQLGVVGAPLVSLARRGRIGDLVPLGLLGRLITVSPGSAAPAMFADRVTGASAPVPPVVLRAWADTAEAVAVALLRDHRDTGITVVEAAGARVDELHVADVVDASPVLLPSLDARLDALGEAVSRALDQVPARASAHGADAALVTAEDLEVVETAAQRVAEHSLADVPDVRDAEFSVAHQARRLVRWLAQACDPAPTFGAAVGRHRDDDAWVDRALAEVERGVPRPRLTDALHQLAAAARVRRAAHDAEFAALLAT